MKRKVAALWRVVFVEYVRSKNRATFLETVHAKAALLHSCKDCGKKQSQSGKTPWGLCGYYYSRQRNTRMRGRWRENLSPIFTRKWGEKSGSQRKNKDTTERLRHHPGGRFGREDY